MSMIQDRIARIRTEIARICQRIGRDPQDITLVGITKYATPDLIKEAVAAGLDHIGENKVQEAQKKFPVLAGRKVTRHMVGHLQTNKVKAALELFDMIDSVDSYKLAEAIRQQAQKSGRSVDILVQVNTAREPQKSGIMAEAAIPLLEQISALPEIRPLGLMTIAPLAGDATVVRGAFRVLKDLFAQAARRFEGHPRIEMKYLSMGMTDDYEIALEEGSTMLRIGRAIFA